MKKTILQSLLIGSAPLIWSLTDNPSVQAETPDAPVSQPATPTATNAATVTQPTPEQPSPDAVVTTAQDATPVTQTQGQNPESTNHTPSDVGNGQSNLQPQPIKAEVKVKPASTHEAAITTSRLAAENKMTAGYLKNNQPLKTDVPTTEALSDYSNLFVDYLSNDNAINQTDFQLTQNATFNGEAVNVSFSTATNLSDAAMQAYLEQAFKDNRLAAMKIFPNQNIKTFLTLTSSANGHTVSAGKNLTIPIKIEYDTVDGTKISPTRTLLDENGNELMVGGSWVTNPIKIPGYHWNNQLPSYSFGEWSRDFNLSALDAQGNLLIKYFYLANQQTAKINFIDQTTGRLLASKTLVGDYKTRANLKSVNQILTKLTLQGYRVVNSNLPKNGFAFSKDGKLMVFTITVALTGADFSGSRQTSRNTGAALNPVVSFAPVIGLKKTHLKSPDTYPKRSSKKDSTAPNAGPVLPNHFNYDLFNLRPIDWHSFIQRATPLTTGLSPAVVLNKPIELPGGGANPPSQLGRYFASLSGNVNFGEVR